MPPAIDVCPVDLPGRGRRFREPLHTRLPALLQELVDELQPHVDLRFALFGHSMGAMIAYELACRLARDGAVPLCLFVSGRRAPQFPRTEPPIHTLSDGALLAKVRAMDGIPPAIGQNHEMLDLALPILRADFALSESYQYVDGPPLTCPIFALSGTSDVEVSREGLLGWRDRTRSIFRPRFFPGGHFFLQHDQAAVVRAVIDDLMGILNVATRWGFDVGDASRARRL
jgi:medium-chain acyl-[acyl-carrier-protein] hydrolase